MENNMEKKRNRNAVRSENMITQAYIGLLQELPAERITVTAIVKRAELNRSTFYAHFGCPEDVHRMLEQRIADELLESINRVDLKNTMKNPRPLLAVLAEIIESRKSFLKLMFERNSSLGWLDRISDAVLDKFLSDTENVAQYKDKDELTVKLRFFVGGYISLCRDYIVNKITSPISELTDILSETIAGGLREGMTDR